MAYEDIQTPCLILDLDALERNVKKMGDYARAHNMRHRAHGKMHKSVDVLKLQMEQGGAIGVCCQKVSEAEVFARAGVKDILISNQVRDLAKIDMLARMPKHGGRVIVCVDDVANVADLSKAAQKHGTELGVFVEIDCGAGRCGVTTTEAVVEIAKAVAAAPGLRFLGIQAYQGAMQHMDSYEDRKAKLDAAIAQVKDAVDGAQGRRASSPSSSPAAAPAATISSRTPASTTSCSAAATPSWTPTTAASTTRTASASTRASGRTRSSS